MKHWRIIFIVILSCVPLALFAAIEQYQNPLGCGITSLPQFIKGILTIIVKVGIPIATIFIIWSGFLFLTAQGDEAQLTKAKKSFLWACIGTAVLLGSWLLATAINATIQSIGGGTSGTDTTTVDGGCGKDAPPTLVTMPPIAAVMHNAHLGVSAGAVGILPDCSVHNTINPVGDAMAENGLSPTDQNLFSKSKTMVHNAAVLKNTEQSYLFFDFGPSAGYLIHNAAGDGVSVPFVNAGSLESFIETSIPGTTRVTYMHSHPISFANGQTPPSIDDLITAKETKIVVAGSGSLPVRHFVADTNGIWEYSVSPGSQFAQVQDTFVNKTKELLALPEVTLPNGVNQCSPGAVLLEIQTKALNGEYGSNAQAIVEEARTAALVLEPFYDQDKKLFGGGLTNQEKLDILQERLVLEQSLGISLAFTPM